MNTDLSTSGENGIDKSFKIASGFKHGSGRKQSCNSEKTITYTSGRECHSASDIFPDTKS
jgi:hypothetical protein